MGPKLSRRLALVRGQEPFLSMPEGQLDSFTKRAERANTFADLPETDQNLIIAAEKQMQKVNERIANDKWHIINMAINEANDARSGDDQSAN